MSNLAPIIVFCYNRPWHVEQTLEALSRNELADQSILYIYCDGPKIDASVEQCQNIAEVRQVVRKRQWCRGVHIVERENNIGLMNNIVSAVTEILNQYGRVIVFEDDMITSPGTLQYFNDALEVYKEEEKVMHIVSYMFPHRWPLPNTFLYTVPYPGGGWATWSRSWKYYPNDIEPLYNYWKDKLAYFNYWNHDERDLAKQLEDNYNGTLRTWFIRWYAVMLRMGGLTLYPGKSLVTNIGFDGTGDNCVKLARNPYWIDNLEPSINVKKIKRIKEHKIGAREIYAFHAGRWYNRRRRTRMINKILSFLCASNKIVNVSESRANV